MSWRKPENVRLRRLSKGEQEAYNAGFDDGVGIVIDRLSDLDPDNLSAEARELVKGLILSHAVETATSD